MLQTADNKEKKMGKADEESQVADINEKKMK